MREERGMRPAARLAAALSRLAGREVGRRELTLLAAAILTGMVVRLAFVALTHDHGLVGDEVFYDRQVRWMLDGKLFYDLEPTGVSHAAASKPPGYSVFLTGLFALTGSGPTRAAALQTLLVGPAGIFLAWLLAARLFARPAVALLTGWGVALYPNVWRWEMRFYPEALALPLALVFFTLVLTRPLTRRVVVAAGLVIGVSLLVRPASLILIPGALVASWVVTDFRRAARATLTATAVAALVVLPWTVRNYVVVDGFVPLSQQDAAAALGTFNDEAATDQRAPWAWRPLPAPYRDLLPPPAGVSDIEWRAMVWDRARAYIRSHPESIPNAFFWNGLVRTWNVHRPANAVLGAPDPGPAYAGLFSYWLLVVLALVGLWRLRNSQRGLVLMTITLAVGASVVFTAAASTRYRVPLEPLVVMLAAATVVRASRGGERS